MSLLAPILLWALLLGLIPPIIEYIMRLRSQQLDWGATYVLEIALKRLQQRWNIERLILIALRVLALLLVALAFVRPAMLQGGGLGDAGVHHIVLVDASYSMDAGPEDDPRINETRRRLASVMDRWTRGQTWSLAEVGQTVTWRVENEPIAETDSMLALAEEIAPTEAPADLAAALREAAERYGEGQTRLYVLSDDQRQTWEPALRAAESAEVASLLDRAMWLASTRGGYENIAVTSLTTTTDLVLARRPLRVVAEVEHFGVEPRQDLAVELRVDDAFVARRVISIQPGQAQKVVFDIEAPATGSHWITASLPPDALEWDNAMHAGVESVDRLDLLVLREPNATGKFESTWSFLEVLSRAANNRPRQAVSWSVAAEPPDLDDPARAPVMLIDSAWRLTAERASRLAELVRQGAAVMLVADPSVPRPAWNELLAAVEIRPGQLSSLRIEPLGGPSPLQPAPVEEETPLSALSAMLDPGETELADAKIYAGQLIVPDDGALVLARFTDQTPWIVQRDAGLGRVLLIGSGLGGTGHNMMVRGFFPDLMERLTRQTAGRRPGRRTVERGEPIVYRLPRGETPDAAALADDDGGLTPIDFEAGATELVIDDPDLPSGRYAVQRVIGGASERAWFGVQGERTDSNLLPITPEQAERLDQSLGVRRVIDDESLEQTLVADAAAQEIYPWLIAAAALALFTELLFQRRFAEPVT